METLITKTQKLTVLALTAMLIVVMPRSTTHLGVLVVQKIWGPPPWLIAVQGLLEIWLLPSGHDRSGVAGVALCSLGVQDHFPMIDPAANVSFPENLRLPFFVAKLNPSYDRSKSNRLLAFAIILGLTVVIYIPALGGSCEGMLLS
jgi:hypothetical protein